jgi:phosphatidylglycerol:prolipoprotein diacylglycerol transferase
MLHFPAIDPVAIALGPVKIHWYGLMYLAGFAAGWWLAVRDTRKGIRTLLTKEQIDDFLFYVAMGVVLGGRAGYVFFYKIDEFLANPLWLFHIWTGGMSFHGGFLGVVLACALFARKHRIEVTALFDYVAPYAIPGLGFGRLGNFIGQELWGRPTDVPWGMVFPRDPLGLARHPSQLYQFALEGVALFIIVFWFTRKPRPRWSVSGLFLLTYGIFRFVVEFVREPDGHIGYEWFGWMTRGQELCIPMIVGGIALLLWAYRNKPDERKPTVQEG